MDWLINGLHASFLMLWDTLWALGLGYLISALLQVFVRPEQMSRHFGRANLAAMSWATLLGALSSSCSYAATSAGRTAFRKGAALPVALAFMFASTNLVVELTALLWAMLGKVFVAAEFLGALVLIAVMWLLVRLTLPKKLEEEARQHAAGAEQEAGHCCSGGDGEEMGEPGGQSRFRAVAEAFRMNVLMVWRELLIGFVAGGFLMTAVPLSWWQALFVSHAPGPIKELENALIGPLIAMISFTCSCGNIPMAAALWGKGISFGGVTAFIYGDLIVIPILLIYTRYYGVRAAGYIAAVMFASMASAAVAIDLVFSAAGVVPAAPQGGMPVMLEHPAWNATAAVDLTVLIVAVVLFLASRPKPSEAKSCAHQDA